MKVSELIEVLKTKNQDAIVCIASSVEESWWSEEVEYVNEFDGYTSPQYDNKKPIVEFD